MATLKTLFAKKQQITFAELDDYLSVEQDFTSAFSELQQHEEIMKGGAGASSEEREHWEHLLIHLVHLAAHGWLDRQTAKRLFEYAALCIKTILAAESRPAVELAYSLGKLVQKNGFQADFLQFIRQVIVPKYRDMAILLYCAVAPGSAETVNFLDQVWRDNCGRVQLRKMADPIFASEFIQAFSEPAYSNLRTIMEWLLKNYPQCELREAADLILGLWYGRYVVIIPENLNEPFYRYFSEKQDRFSQEITFAIAAITLRVDKMVELIEAGRTQASWAREYGEILRAFALSFHSKTHATSARTLVPPHRKDFPPPVYSLICAAYVAHLEKSNAQAEIKKYSAEISGPWKSWMEQADAKLYPYQPMPNYAKLESLLRSELVKDDLKIFIAPWLVEMAFMQRGDTHAEQLVRQLPALFQAVAQTRLAALQKPFTAPAELASPNDLIAAIRSAAAMGRADMAEKAAASLLAGELHEYERELARFVVTCLQGLCGEAEIEQALDLAEKGLPIAAWLIARRLFMSQNYLGAIRCLRIACAKAPGRLSWQALLAQALANSGQTDAAAVVLTSVNAELDPDARKLLAWLLFAQVFKDKSDLLAFALDSGAQMAPEQKNSLHKASTFIPASDNNLRPLLLAILDQLEDPAASPALKNPPGFAAEWLTIRQALTAPSCEAALVHLEAMADWPDGYGGPIARIAAASLLQRSDVLQLNPKKLKKLLKAAQISEKSFYYGRLVEDIRQNLDPLALQEKYADLYDESQPLFRLILIHAAIQQQDFARALDLLASPQGELNLGWLKLKLVCQARLQKWPELFSTVRQLCDAQADDPLIPDLVTACLEIMVAIKDEHVSRMLNLAVQHGVSAEKLVGAVKFYLLRKFVQSSADATPSELREQFMQFFEAQYRPFLELFFMPFTELAAALPSLTARKSWGYYLYHKVMRLLLDEMKKLDAGNAQALLGAHADGILQYLGHNELSDLDSAEIEALRRVAAASQGKRQCITSLNSILRLANTTELVELSSGLLQALSYPDSPAGFIKAAYDYAASAHPDFADRAAHLIAVITCWAEEMLARRYYGEEDWKNLIKLLTELRLALYTSRQFKEWFLGRRRQLPDKEQYLPQAEAWLDGGFYDWLVSQYTSDLNELFSLQKDQVGKILGEWLLQLGTDPVALLAASPFPPDEADPQRLQELKSAAAEAVKKWIAEKKGILDESMRPDEKASIHYALNYAKGLALLKRLNAMLPNNKELLGLGLHYANLWNHDHENKAQDAAREITARSPIAREISGVITEYSNFFADPLRALCKPGPKTESAPENQEMARHYYFKALVDNQEKPYEWIREVLKWDSTHTDIGFFYRSKTVEEVNNGTITPQTAIMRVKELQKLFTGDNNLTRKLREDMTALENL